MIKVGKIENLEKCFRFLSYGVIQLFFSDACPKLTPQDEPLDASIETLEMIIQKFDVDWKANGFNIPSLNDKFPRSKVQFTKKTQRSL